MPHMDGIEATRRIRAFEGDSKRTPIIALTANVMEDDRLKCFEAGMDAFVSKPVRTQEIQKALRMFLKEKPM